MPSIPAASDSHPAHRVTPGTSRFFTQFVDTSQVAADGNPNRAGATASVSIAPRRDSDYDYNYMKAVRNFRH